MTKRQLILQSHVRNEEFVRELQPIVSLWIMALLFMYGLQESAHKKAQDPQTRWRNIRAAVGIVKDMVDRLEALLEKWPNAVCLFFPETGHGGRVRLCREFYTEIYPGCFPEAHERSRGVRLGASVAIVGVAFLRELGKRAIAHSVCGIYSRLAVAPWRSL